MDVQPRKRLRTHFYDALLPHEGNGFKPLLFTMTGVGAVIVVLLLVQAAYFVQTKIVFTQTSFLASVLPGVLATLTNEDRQAVGIASLIEDTHLARAAQMKAEDMAMKGYFAHVDPEGRQPWYWMDQAGYDYTYAGENLAVNFTDSKDVQEAWMNSPTHHANIVKSQYTRIGIGVAQGTYQGKETTFVVQFFATPRANAAFQAAVVRIPTEDAGVTPEGESSIAVEREAPAEEAGVLGVEVDTVAPSAPPEEPIRQMAYEARVAGATNETVSFISQVATSPTHTVIYILAGLAGLIAVLLLLAIGAHMRVAYLEVIGGGLLIILVALSLLVFNAMSDDDVTIPAESLPASAIEAF